MSLRIDSTTGGGCNLSRLPRESDVACANLRKMQFANEAVGGFLNGGKRPSKRFSFVPRIAISMQVTDDRFNEVGRTRVVFAFCNKLEKTFYGIQR